MRLYNTGLFPVIGATAAALMMIQVPPAAIAQAEQQHSTVPATSPATSPTRAPVVAPVASQAAPAAVVVTEAGANPAETSAAPAEPAKPKPLPPTLVARINLTSQTMTVQAGGTIVHTWKVSSGAPGYATPTGTFKPGWMAQMWHSRQYDDAPMPHSVFFNGGIAVHATTSIGNLGRAASHGCVRLAPANAAKFYSLVTKHGMSRTRIVVPGAQPFSAQSDRIAKLNRGRIESNRNNRTARARNPRTGNEWTIAPQQNGNTYRISSAGRTASAWGDTYGYSNHTPRRTATRSQGNSTRY